MSRLVLDQPEKKFDNVIGLVFLMVLVVSDFWQPNRTMVLFTLNNFCLNDLMQMGQTVSKIN